MPATPLFQSFVMGGFECSTHRLHTGQRLDLIHATGHDRLALEDYRRLQSVGIQTARDGLRWHLIEDRPGHYDFGSFLPMLRASQRCGLQVIWDLCHYGWPDGLDIFSSAFIDRFAAYSLAVAEVLRDEGETVPFLTPINELSFLSWAGGEVGYLNPFAHGQGGALKRQLVRASIASIEAVRSVLPAARLVQCEPLVAVHLAAPEPQPTRHAAHAYQYESLDLLTGRAEPALGGRPEYLDILGLNYYPTNQWVHDGPRIGRSDPRYRPLHDLLLEVHGRYGRPMLIAETGTEDAERADWMRYVGQEVLTAMHLGVPLHGVCLYPVVNHPGWDDQRHCHNGLWDYPNGDERALYQPLAKEVQALQLGSAALTRPAGTEADFLVSINVI